MAARRKTSNRAPKSRVQVQVRVLNLQVRVQVRVTTKRDSSRTRVRVPSPSTTTLRTLLNSLLSASAHVFAKVGSNRIRHAGLHLCWQLTYLTGNPSSFPGADDQDTSSLHGWYVNWAAASMYMENRHRRRRVIMHRVYAVILTRKCYCLIKLADARV